MAIDEKLEPDFAKRNGLVVAIAQEAETKQVLMQAYMNKQAWEETLKNGYAVYWSTSRNEIWRKGETSGDQQKVREIYLDCDRDSVLLLVEQKGKGACHDGYFTCFYNRIAKNA